MKNINEKIGINLDSKCAKKLNGQIDIRYTKSFKQIIILQRMLARQIGIQHWLRIKGQLEDNI